ncbi:MAG TPA: 3-oxoacyl-ACP synthase III family protein [Candidatus Nanoarchaeia archaeon]|nr:3-oxoacyl-ACP synthase III family protein [Candidatus Nanoarchaeia archaeon]
MFSQGTRSVIITGAGHYIPEVVKRNEDFGENTFFNTKGEPYDTGDCISSIKRVSGIEERRYISEGQTLSNIASLAAQNLFDTNPVIKESLDLLVVAHNSGNVNSKSLQPSAIPNIGALVKQELGIGRSEMLTYDLIAGCPGFLILLSSVYDRIISGRADKAGVIGAEAISPLLDEHNRDSMLFGDGAGMVSLEGVMTRNKVGILSIQERSDSLKYAGIITTGKSMNPAQREHIHPIIEGSKVSKYALGHVPQVIKASIEKAGLGIKDIDLLLIHQANLGLNYGIGKRLFELYEMKIDEPDLIKSMPMTIQKLGNTSVASIPTLISLIMKGELEGYEIKPGSNMVMASVGAGMHISSIVYRVPKAQDFITY